jgi:hypothetical protein
MPAAYDWMQYFTARFVAAREQFIAAVTTFSVLVFLFMDAYPFL